MAKGTRICKVCGKEYEYCHTWNNNNKFRYQDVACSPECGATYFAKIAESRAKEAAAMAMKDEEKNVNQKAEEPIVSSEKTENKTDDGLAEECEVDEKYDSYEAVG